jgi:hypothetical protein
VHQIQLLQKHHSAAAIFTAAEFHSPQSDQPAHKIPDPDRKGYEWSGHLRTYFTFSEIQFFK